jgi:hypothetical protein
VTSPGHEPWPDADPVRDLAGFRRALTGGVTARFGAGQANIIRSLVSQVIELISDEQAQDQPDESSPSQDTSPRDELAAQLGLSDNAELPDDPILARLLPDAYSGDPKAAAEFRRYTEVSLRSGKVAAAQTVLDTLPPDGGKVRISEADAQAWLRALNDVRLSLGVVLGVDENFDEQVEELSPEDPRAAYVGVYQWLAYLQESLVESLE